MTTTWAGLVGEGTTEFARAPIVVCAYTCAFEIQGIIAQQQTRPTASVIRFKGIVVAAVFEESEVIMKVL